MHIVHPSVERYLRELQAMDDEPVLLEMENLAEKRGFPIIGRLCGRFLEVMARAVGAERVFEMGSGFGYSAYWFARAVGADGEVHLTDTEPGNEKMALDFLSRAKLVQSIQFHVADAFEALERVEGKFDIVYCDIDKDAYPRAWEVGKKRVRVGGFYLCDNMLWSGRVTGDREAPADSASHAIDATNRAIASDEAFRSFILPTRDGVVAAMRISS